MLDVEQLIDGPGFVLIPNLITAFEAAEARSRLLELAGSPSAQGAWAGLFVGPQLGHVIGTFATLVC